jgi:oxygen-independent coproporphyrinogen-3 oxidase
MSSIGYIDSAFFQNHSLLDSYNKAVADRGLAVYRGIKLSQDDLIRQFVINSLMCNFRLDFTELKGRLGVSYQDYFKGEHEGLEGFFDDGFMEQDNDGLRITPLGRVFVRNIAMTFDAYLKRDDGHKKSTFSKTI